MSPEKVDPVEYEEVIEHVRTDNARAEIATKIVAFTTGTISLLVVESTAFTEYFLTTSPALFVLHDVLRWMVTEAGVLTIVASICELYITSSLLIQKVEIYSKTRFPVEEINILLMALSCLLDQILYSVNKLGRTGPNMRSGNIDQNLTVVDIHADYTPAYYEYSSFQVVIYQINMGMDLLFYIGIFIFTLYFLYRNYKIYKRLKRMTMQRRRNEGTVPPSRRTSRARLAGTNLRGLEPVSSVFHPRVVSAAGRVGGRG